MVNVGEEKVRYNVNWEWFRERREAIDRRFSQNEMARRLGMDVSSLSNMMTGKQTVPLKRAIQFAIILHVTLDEVLEHLGYNLKGVITKKEAAEMDDRARQRLLEKRMSEYAPEEDG